jgi:hypothetical protein
MRGAGRWRRFKALLCATGAAAVLPIAAAQPATAYPGGIWEPGPAKYGSLLVRNVKITMDDGVILDAAVSFPTDLATGQRAAGRFPVVLEHTVYAGSVGGGNPVNTYFTSYGYISVKVNARGTHASGGEFVSFAPRDARDGKALIEWAAHQLDGADGRVAMNGCSYPGGYALLDSAAVGPNSPLKAVVAACMGYEGLERRAWMYNGLLTKSSLSAMTAAAPLLGNTPSAIAFWADTYTRLFGGGDASYAASDFYQQRTPMSKAVDVVRNGVPVLLWTGWGDNVETAAIRTYVAFQNAYANRRPAWAHGWKHDKEGPDAQMHPHQRTTPRYQIIVGNWGHAQGLDNGIRLQWIETWLRGVDTGIQNTRTPMHVFESGSNRWVNLATYPSVQKYTSFYLDGAALSTRAPRVGPADDLYWGSVPAMPGNVLTYTTTPFAEGATLSGPISATVYASSSNTNLELIATLFDVAPDGTAQQISQGAALASQRELDPKRSWEDHEGVSMWPWPRLARDSYLKPGRVYRVDVSLPPRQWQIQPGHQLRLHLAGQGVNTPEYCAQPGQFILGPQVCPLFLTPQQLASLPGGTYRVYQGRHLPSALNVPLAPALIFSTAASGATPTSNGTVMPLDWGPTRTHGHGRGHDHGD